MSEIMSLAISFLSCFLQTPVGVIILTWAQVARVTTFVTGQTKSRAPNICLAAMFTESLSQGIFCTLALVTVAQST